MILSHSDLSALPRIIVPLLAALLLVSATHNPAQAAERKTFVIDDSEGYGIMDCLTSGKACGRVVADAWCEAHGLGQALAFGKSDDVTGSVQLGALPPGSLQAGDLQAQPLKSAPANVTANAVKPGSVVVTCDN